MKGFVLALRRAKNEDSIAIVLSKSSVRSYYRFFGARHSILQYGNLIDFEVEGDDGRFMPKLRGISQIGFPWIYDRNKLASWHAFIGLFEPHLRDIQEVDSFYYELILRLAKRWHKQNTKRLTCEGYMDILHHEGRVYPIVKCFICDDILLESISLMATFKPAHPECIYSASINRATFEKYIKTRKTIHMNDREVEQVYNIILKGL